MTGVVESVSSVAARKTGTISGVAKFTESASAYLSAWTTTQWLSFNPVKVWLAFPIACLSLSADRALDDANHELMAFP